MGSPQDRCCLLLKFYSIIFLLSKNRIKRYAASRNTTNKQTLHNKKPVCTHRLLRHSSWQNFATIFDLYKYHYLDCYETSLCLNFHKSSLRKFVTNAALLCSNELSWSLFTKHYRVMWKRISLHCFYVLQIWKQKSSGSWHAILLFINI